MKKLFAFLATFGISPFVFYLVLSCVLFGSIGLGLTFCGKRKVVIPPIPQTTLDKLASKNEQEKTAAVNEVINRIDAETKLNDEQRAVIKKELETSSKKGVNVRAEDFRRLIEENE